MIRALRPLAHREFRVLTTATLVSVFGDGLMRVALPLLVSETASPPLGAAALSVTLQVSVPPLVSELLLQVRLLRLPLKFFDLPLPLRCTCVEFPPFALLVNVSVPEAVPVAEGANPTFRLVDWPAPRVKGKLVFPTRRKPCPETEASEMVNAVELVF